MKMKAFLFRELAFLMAPIFFFTSPLAIIYRAGGALAMFVFALVALSTVFLFVLLPVGWWWLGVALGVGASLLALCFVFLAGF
jgi:hypothetical protein